MHRDCGKQDQNEKEHVRYVVENEDGGKDMGVAINNQRTFSVGNTFTIVLATNLKVSTTTQSVTKKMIYMNQQISWT